MYYLYLLPTTNRILPGPDPVSVSRKPQPAALLPFAFRLPSCYLLPALSALLFFIHSSSYPVPFIFHQISSKSILHVPTPPCLCLLLGPVYTIVTDADENSASWMVSTLLYGQLQLFNFVGSTLPPSVERKTCKFNFNRWKRGGIHSRPA